MRSLEQRIDECRRLRLSIFVNPVGHLVGTVGQTQGREDHGRMIPISDVEAVRHQHLDDDKGMLPGSPYEILRVLASLSEVKLSLLPARV